MIKNISPAKEKVKDQPRVIVSAFIFNDKNEVFLGRGYKQDLKFIPPGGGIKTGERMSEALEREVKEETGLKIKDLEVLGVIDGYKAHKYQNSPYKHLIFIDFRARLKGEAKIKLNKEFKSGKWQSVEKWATEKELGHFTKEAFRKYFLQPTEDWQAKYQRALADYQNLLKQTAKEKTELIKFANEELLRDIVPVFDNLKMAISHEMNKQGNSWLEGIKYVVKQFREVLRQNGVLEIKTKGEKFDHNLMEAVSGQGNKVVKEIRPGYTLNGKVIIPAKVELGDK